MKSWLQFLLAHTKCQQIITLRSVSHWKTSKQATSQRQTGNSMAVLTGISAIMHTKVHIAQDLVMFLIMLKKTRRILHCLSPLTWLKTKKSASIIRDHAIITLN